MSTMLNKYLKDQENKATSLEQFEASIDDRLCEIKELIKTLQKEAQNYDGICFTDELDEFLHDLI